MLIEKVDPKAFGRLLASEATERRLHLYIRRHPWILYWAVCPASGHSRYVLSGFPLGSRHRTDFAILNSYSGAFEVTFVELEPASDRVFTKAGTPSRRMAGAIKQIDDWREYFMAHQHEVRRTLKDWAVRHDLLGYSERAPLNYAAQEFMDPSTPLLDRYLVVIGRSSQQPVESRSLAGRFRAGYDTKILSYDRLLLTAQRRYGAAGAEQDLLPNRALQPLSRATRMAGAKRVGRGSRLNARR